MPNQKAKRSTRRPRTRRRVIKNKLPAQPTTPQDRSQAVGHGNQRALHSSLGQSPMAEDAMGAPGVVNGAPPELSLERENELMTEQLQILHDDRKRLQDELRDLKQICQTRGMAFPLDLRIKQMTDQYLDHLTGLLAEYTLHIRNSVRHVTA